MSAPATTTGGRFRPRPTRASGLLAVNGWRLKGYEITLDGGPVDPDVVAAARACLEAALPQAGADGGVGFAIVHHGLEGIWLLADLWRGDIVSQHTFCADLDDHTRFRPVPAGGPTACVWELAVHAHERDAYVAHVLDPAEGPDEEAYLADTNVAGSVPIRELIERFDDAWGRGDVDSLMALMTDDPVYRASTGSGPGREYQGRGEVRAGFADVIRREAAASAARPPAEAREVLVAGNCAVSSWRYPLETSDGTTWVEGVDVWTVENGRIAIKDAYRKSFPDERRSR